MGYASPRESQGMLKFKQSAIRARPAQPRTLQKNGATGPRNIRRNMLNGALEYDKRDLIFRVGGNWYENIPIILQYKNTPIVACSLKDGQAKVSLNLFDPFGRITRGEGRTAYPPATS
jgi:hypothetical protein